jgi:hypothetical protein
MKHIRWYDKNSNLKKVFEFIQELDAPVQNEIAKDIIQILMNDLKPNLDEKINTIGKSYNYKCKRWYDNNIDLFSSFELIKNLPNKRKDEVVKKIAESVLLMYFDNEKIKRKTENG